MYLSHKYLNFLSLKHYNNKHHTKYTIHKHTLLLLLM